MRNDSSKRKRGDSSQANRRGRGQSRKVKEVDDRSRSIEVIGEFRDSDRSDEVDRKSPVADRRSKKKKGKGKEDTTDEGEEGEEERGHKQFDSRFDKKRCLNELSSIRRKFEKILTDHVDQMEKLYESINEVIGEDYSEKDSNDSDIDEGKVLNRKFYNEISELSSIVNELNDERVKEDDENMLSRLEIDQIQNDIDMRPQLLFDFFKERVKPEFKRSFKLLLKNHKLISDSKEFKRRYNDLIKVSIT
ncbi:expressed protein [Phakopsora pachyrhizi]|uniref:Expressed protein n=1 Tax=Phakopsora pachyrhizi TaxID=170000 RepID=A0AAV0BL85_PHAPC|nr:expressed protein [Phakopsora pachyrhizi]